LLGLCCAGWIARPFLRDRIAVSGLLQGSLTLVAGAAMLLSANFALSGQLAWTPGGYGVAFGRMLQDGIVKRYLDDHCPQQQRKLCPYRNELPDTADRFLWGSSIFNALGRFKGLNDEMGLIVRRRSSNIRCARPRPLSSPPRSNSSSSEPAKAPRLDRPYLWHHRALSAGRSQADAPPISKNGHRLSAINRLHVPVALGSMRRSSHFAMAIWRRRLDDLTLLAATVTLALLGNAFVCGVISGPRPRRAPRMVASFVALIALVRHFAAAKPNLTSAVRENPARPP
jgi:hypothetical protein